MEIVKRTELNRVGDPKPMTEPTCPRCSLPAERSEEHDAYYCAACNIWLEARCADPECEFCVGRAEKPLQSEAMQVKLKEKIVIRLLFYPETNKVVAHIYDAKGHLRHRASMDAHEAGSFRATVARLLAALGAKVESDPSL